jgi:hypothetical protein
MAYMNETRIEYLERNIAEVRAQRDLLQNKPWGASIAEEDSRLWNLERAMSKELSELRPYHAVQNGSGWIIEHNGNFVEGETEDSWLTFPTAAQANAWINDQTAFEVAA